jgi:glutathione S-transferase
MSYKLTYFDFPGEDSIIYLLFINTNINVMFSFSGRAFAIRSAFKHANIDFVDELVTREQLQASKGTAGASEQYPLGGVPVLTLPDGRVVTQSGAIARYVGKLANLYPSDPLDALRVDELLDSFNDVGSSTPYSKDENEKKSLREAWAAGKLRVIFTFYASKLASNSSSEFAVGSSLTLADFYMYVILKMFRSGFFDHVPKDYDAQWPVIGEYLTRLENNPVFAPYKY